MLTVRLTGPEVIAALYRKVRTGELRSSEVTRAAARFRADWQQRYQISEAGIAITEQAMELAAKHGLRAYDAVHLAAALEFELDRAAFGLAPLIFLSADADQLTAAAAEGLLADNPNAHP